MNQWSRDRHPRPVSPVMNHGLNNLPGTVVFTLWNYIKNSFSFMDAVVACNCGFIPSPPSSSCSSLYESSGIPSLSLSLSLSPSPWILTGTPSSSESLSPSPDEISESDSFPSGYSKASEIHGYGLRITRAFWVNMNSIIIFITMLTNVPRIIFVAITFCNCIGIIFLALTRSMAWACIFYVSLDGFNNWLKAATSMLVTSA